MNKLLLSLLTSAPNLVAGSLFDPVPHDQLRDLAADRPDTTESPITVDAGHIQIEASLYNYRENDGNESHTYGAINFKLGLTDSSDLQFVFDSYVDEQGGGQGVSDLTIRYKYNLWGNDGGDTAFALFPFVKIPTNSDLSNEQWEGGLILPFSINLAEGIGLGLMGEFDYLYNDDADEHQLEFLHSAALGFDVTARFGAYLEYVGIITEGGYQAFLGGGLTYALNDNLVWDVGAQFGLNEDAEDLSLFTGFTVRY